MSTRRFPPPAPPSAANGASFNGFQRGKLMMKLADLMQEEAERLGRYETQDNGKLLKESVGNVNSAARYYRFFAGSADKLNGETIPMDNASMFDYTLREPIGVIAILTPWNAPLSILANALAPSLAAGNTVVIKPSEYTSVTTAEFAKLTKKAGFPDGVINVVTGGADVGGWLTSHPGIGKISFTGGAGTARHIAASASKNLVPLMLELGGKSPNIVFDDADLEKAALAAAQGVFGSAGQTCIAGSRILVQRRAHDQLVELMVARAAAYRMGDPLAPETRLGPMAYKAHHDRVLDVIGSAVSDGGTVAFGGGKPDMQGADKDGLFISPTILTGLTNEAPIAREEVFGPVAVVLPFDDDDQALEIANDTEYGLAAGVWTGNIARAHRFAKDIEAGQVWINTYRNSGAMVPFGGVKRSGYGRARGYASLLEYTQIQERDDGHLLIAFPTVPMRQMRRGRDVQDMD